MRNESDSGWSLDAQSAGLNPSGEWSECEHVCWDPKDGELCLSRAKPGETLVEARSDSDVQIDRQIWVEGRKTNRTILVAGSLRNFPQDSWSSSSFIG